LKILQGSAFINLKEHFQDSLEKIFLAPADTFDNVKGQFPIGFKIWNTNKKEIFENIVADVYDKNANFIGEKGLHALNKTQYINKFISIYKTTNENNVGYMDGINGNDFQHNNIVYVLNTKEQLPNPRGIWINQNNLIPVSIYYAVRKAIKANWLNDRDQFLNPNENWKTDKEFQNDCLTFTIFNTNIQTKFGLNHWTPFTEQEVNAKEKFHSNFMSNYLNGKLKTEQSFGSLFDDSLVNMCYDNKILEFSKEAVSVFDAGRELWKYYHSQQNINVDANLYEMKEYFQGRSDKGILKSKSSDEKYTELITYLRESLNLLADKIKPKIYEYEFLKD